MSNAVTLSADDLEHLIRRANTHPAHFDEDSLAAFERAKQAVTTANQHPEQLVEILAPPEVTEFHPREEELKAFFGHPACREVMQDFLNMAVLSALSPITESTDYDHPNIVLFAEGIVRNPEWYEGLLARFHIE